MDAYGINRFSHDVAQYFSLCTPVLKECLWPWPFSWQVWHCLLWSYFIRYEPPHDKTNKMAWDGCPGWSESSLGTHVILLVLSCCGSIIMFVFQRHRVRIIPVTQALYRWKDTDSDFFVYGFEKKVHAPSYPQQCCCGCSLLWDAPSNSYCKKSPWKWRTSPHLTQAVLPRRSSHKSLNDWKLLYIIQIWSHISPV